MKRLSEPSSSQLRCEGFSGQKLVVLPNQIIAEMQRERTLAGLFPTATGHFPEAVGHYVNRPNGVPETIVIVCLSGCGWARIDGREPKTILANEVLIIPPCTPHAYGADAARPWSILWVHFRGTEAPEWLNLLEVTLENPLIRMPAHVLAGLEFSAIYKNLDQGYSFANLLMAASRLRWILAALNQLRLTHYPRAQTAGDAIQQSLDWMSDNLHHPARLDELASLAGLSVPYYCALFRRKTGYSPVDYFLRLKVQQACQWLDTTDRRVADIASAIGFDDPFHFSRFFRRITGHSPRGYRNIPKG